MFLQCAYSVRYPARGAHAPPQPQRTEEVEQNEKPQATQRQVAQRGVIKERAPAKQRIRNEKYARNIDKRGLVQSSSVRPGTASRTGAVRICANVIAIAAAEEG